MINTIFYPTRLKKFLFFFLADILIIIFSLYSSFLLRFDFTISARLHGIFLSSCFIFLLAKLTLFGLFKIYKLTWRHVGLADTLTILKALTISEAIAIGIITILGDPPPFLGFLRLPDLHGFPRSIYIIDVVTSFLLLSALRFSKRIFLEAFIREKYSITKKRVLIIGAGATGEMVLRDIVKNISNYYPVGYLDDNKQLAGSYIHGVKVLGSTLVLKEIVLRRNVNIVIIAIPSLGYQKLREIYKTAISCNIKDVKIVPRLYDFYKPKIRIKSLEDIKIEDLLKRQLVKVDYDSIGKFLTGNVIFISGAAGSIGSELTKQMASFNPEKMVLFDSDETALYRLERILNELFPDLSNRIFFVIGDITDQERVRAVYRTFSPTVVFHVAAYKHVPMMEKNPQEAMKVNVLGTYIMAKISVENNVKKFIFISTDKAVKPVSVMGATKRVGEYVCEAFNAMGKTEFISVRFGNVLGSRGSVLPLFLEQLKNGGPITVTHQDAERYFMTTPEAVSLILQASATGKGGQSLILDMGQSINILELAKDLIKLHGLAPYKDIDIKFTGLRPGEKLYEEILTKEEDMTPTKHETIFILKNKNGLGTDYLSRIEKAVKTAKDTASKEDITRLLKNLVPSYVPIQ